MALWSLQGNLDYGATYSAAARTHGVQFDVSSTVWVTHIRFRRASTAVTQPRTAAIWTDAGTSPISGTQISLPDIGTQVGWFEVALPTPVQLDPGRYRVGAHTPTSGTHHGVGNFFSTGAGANGYSSGSGSPIVAPGANTATNNAQSCYTDGSSIAKPTTSSGSKALYAVDVLVNDQNPNQQVSQGGGSTRSLTSASVVGRKLGRGVGSSTSRVIGLEGRGYGRRRGAGTLLVRSLMSGAGKARKPGQGYTTSRDGGSALARTRRYGSQSNARSFSWATGGGGRQITGGGSTASISLTAGRGKAKLGGALKVLSSVVAAGKARLKGSSSARLTTLTSSLGRTVRRGRASTRSVDTGSGRARTRRRGRGAVLGTSTAAGSGVVRIVGAAGDPRPHVGMAVRLFDANGALSDYAPDWRSINFTDQLNSDGAVTISYIKSGVNASRLMSDRCEGALFDGDREIPGTRFLVTQQSSDAVSESADGQTVTINAPLWVPTRLSEATVYPSAWPQTETPTTNFGAATPGAIVGTLIARAKSRGAVPDLVQNFSASVDSNGRSWSKQVTIEIKPGGSLRSVLNTLTEMGVCDWASNGRELILKNPESGKDYTVGDNPLVLQAGRDILDAPVKRDATEYFTCVLVEGEENTIVEVRHPTEYGRRGRIEGYISAGNIRDVGTLRVIGEAAVARAALPKTENNHQLSLFSPDGPQPWIDYKIGDYLYRSIGKGTAPERLRVSQLTFDCTESGLVSASITLGDRFLSDVDRLNKRINALTNSSTGTSAPADNKAKDNKPPAKPTGLLINSNAYTVDNGTEWGGTTMAAVSASWVPVTLNTDGSPLSDLDRYEVRWKVVRT